MSPTLNAGENHSDVRATVLAVTPIDIRNAIRGGGVERAAIRRGRESGQPGDPCGTLSGVVSAVAVMGSVTHTLTADGSDGSEDGTGRGTPIITFSHTAGIDCQPSRDVTPTVMSGHDRMPSDAGHAVVRRLTPVEVERLQAFPDGWTDVDGKADSHRYRQMGNAVTINTVEWIARRIVAVEDGAL